MSLYLRLFWEFFKTGLFAVGGGMATLPFMYDISDKTGWFTHSMLADMVAVSESTPGPIGVNMATYVGFVTGGIPGAVVATVGLVTPSVIVILLIARVLKAFRENQYVDAGFYGLRPCSIGLIAAAGVLVIKLALFNTELLREHRSAARSVQLQGAHPRGGAAGRDALHKEAQGAAPDSLYPRLGSDRDSILILTFLPGKTGEKN